MPQTTARILEPKKKAGRISPADRADENVLILFCFCQVSSAPCEIFRGMDRRVRSNNSYPRLTGAEACACPF